MISNGLQVVERTGDRLAVLIPPLGFSFQLFFAAAVLLVLAVFLKNASSAIRLLLGGVCLFLLVLALYLGTSRTLLVLSRSQHTLRIDKEAFGLEVSNKSYPLDNVAAFGLYSSRSNKGNVTSYDISVQLKSGQEFGVVGATTNRAGFQTAVDALNGFLGE